MSTEVSTVVIDEVKTEVNNEVNNEVKTEVNEGFRGSTCSTVNQYGSIIRNFR